MKEAFGQRQMPLMYRLLMRGTVEERLMDLHEGKAGVPTAAVSADSSAPASWDLSQLVYLFSPPGNDPEYSQV